MSTPQTITVFLLVCDRKCIGVVHHSLYIFPGDRKENREAGVTDKQTSIYPIPSLYPYLDLQVGHFAASVAADFEDLRERYDDSVLGYCDAPVKRNVIHNCLEFKRRRNTPIFFFTMNLLHKTKITIILA